jgi:hypothetical protein
MRFPQNLFKAPPKPADEIQQRLMFGLIAPSSLFSMLSPDFARARSKSTPTRPDRCQTRYTRSAQSQETIKELWQTFA